MSFAAIVLGLPLVIAGAVLIWCAVSVTLRAREAATWPLHPATVLESSISTIGMYRTYPSGGVARQLQIRYEWHINGRRYKGSRERFTIWRLGGRTPDEAWDRLAAAVPGSTIQVYVDPDNPGQAVIDPAIDQAAVLTSGLLGLLFGGYGVWLIASGL